MFHRFSVVNSAFDDGVFIFSHHAYYVHSADNFNNVNVVSAGVFLFFFVDIYAKKMFQDGNIAKITMI